MARGPHRVALPLYRPPRASSGPDPLEAPDASPAEKFDSISTAELKGKLNRLCREVASCDNRSHGIPKAQQNCQRQGAPEPPSWWESWSTEANEGRESRG